MHIYVKHILYISYNTYVHTLKACKHFFSLFALCPWLIHKIYFLSLIVWSNISGVLRSHWSGEPDLDQQAGITTWCPVPSGNLWPMCSSKQELVPGVQFRVGITDQCAVQPQPSLLLWEKTTPTFETDTTGLC